MRVQSRSVKACKYGWNPHNPVIAERMGRAWVHYELYSFGGVLGPQGQNPLEDKRRFDA